MAGNFEKDGRWKVLGGPHKDEEGRVPLDTIPSPEDPPKAK